MIKTKLFKQKGSKYWRLFVLVDGKYKMKFKSEDKNEVKKQREIFRHSLAVTKAYTDVRISELPYYQLQLLKKILNHKTFNKTINYLISEAFNKYAKQQTFLEKQPH